ncbi:MAG: hypothetical protein Q4C22_07750, partial [Bacillota bacterium]|nr:hypothetical protein [Bacillota bacterium]
MLTALALLCALLPGQTFTMAAEPASGYLCGHVHSEACGYAEGSPCTHVHTHDEGCGYAEESPCTYVHIHDESCG